MCLFAQHLSVVLILKGKYMPLWFSIITSYSHLQQYFTLMCCFCFASYSWKALRVQKCHSGFKTNISDNEFDRSNGPSTSFPEKQNGQSNLPSSTSFQEEQNDKTKSPNIYDDDFDLDALAEALEQAATLASNSKKKNKSKRSNTPIKRHVLKEKESDPRIPGMDFLLRARYHEDKVIA
jgi:hypothetical protein